MAASVVLAAKMEAKYKTVVRRSIATGHKLKVRSLNVKTAAVVKKPIGKKKELIKHGF